MGATTMTLMVEPDQEFQAAAIEKGLDGIVDANRREAEQGRRTEGAKTITRPVKIGLIILLVLVLGIVYFAWRNDVTNVGPNLPVGMVGAAQLKPGPSPTPLPEDDPFDVGPWRVISDTGNVAMPHPAGVQLPPNAACRGRTFTAGNDAYHSHHRAYWCYTTGVNRHLTYDEREGWGTINDQFWDYHGYWVGARGGCVGGNNCHYSFVRLIYHFSACIPPYGCEHDYPWIQMTVRDDGTSTPDWG